jgi:predicted dehydrogenase
MAGLLKTIRVGFIGAGGNTIAKHIPLIRSLPNVELIGDRYFKDL